MTGYAFNYLNKTPNGKELAKQCFGKAPGKFFPSSQNSEKHVQTTVSVSSLPRKLQSGGPLSGTPKPFGRRPWGNFKAPLKGRHVGSESGTRVGKRESNSRNSVWSTTSSAATTCEVC